MTLPWQIARKLRAFLGYPPPGGGRGAGPRWRAAGLTQPLPALEGCRHGGQVVFGFDSGPQPLPTPRGMPPAVFRKPQSRSLPRDTLPPAPRCTVVAVGGTQQNNLRRFNT